jgi:hypothetical protein
LPIFAAMQPTKSRKNFAINRAGNSFERDHNERVS